MARRTADGYVRVSRRGGREGESFISPEVQRQRIDQWSKANDVQIIQWWEELDQSGAKRNRPMFQQALERCERGETGGIVVAKLDRFARSAVDALESIKRLNEAGARLVSVEDGFDGSTAMGRFAIGILTLIAELELERIRENWDTAVSAAVKRGVHISARTPTGYQRDENARLVPNEPTATVIREAFHKRALGMSFPAIAAFLDGQGVQPSAGGPLWSAQGVRGLLRNRVYLGEARSGNVVNRTAHQAIVTEAEFEAAQQRKTLLEPRGASAAATALLGGLLRCGGCGHTLKISGLRNRKSGALTASYYCIGRYSSGLCPARASATATTIDPYVEAQVLALLSGQSGLIADAVAASTEVEDARRRVEAAAHELDLYLAEPLLLTTLGQTKFLEGAQARRDALDDASSMLATLRAQTEFADTLLNGDLLAAWPTLTIQEKRQLLHGLLDRVVLTRAGARGRQAPRIADRTEIILRGGTVLPPTTTQPGRIP
jgi:site-specific DNA recombinase